ncbi:MAG: aldo/keto reductase, partial [Bacteroidota bacterium]
FLGTAMWGWTVPKEHCFQLLDAYYERGGRRVDTATNYPINKKAEDFRKAETWLAEWIRTRRVDDLQVLIKVGSIDNLGGPENRLLPSFLLMALDHYRGLFGDNLRTFSLHWDNREDQAAIAKTVDVLLRAEQQGLETGLSGIKHPTGYVACLDSFKVKPWLQVKHHIFQSGLDYYQDLLSRCRPIAYGLTAGGIKRNGQYKADSSLQARGAIPTQGRQQKEALEDLFQSFSQEIPSVHHLGLMHAWFNTTIQGVLLGPSRVSQLQTSLQFLQRLNSDSSYQSVAQRILDWQANHPYFAA